MRRGVRVERLDVTDPDAIVTYETLFYECFAELPAQKLIRDLWQWDDEAGRIRTHVPYADQRIYVIDDRHGVLALGFAVNVGMHRLQASHYGFSVPPDSGRACEYLVLFSREKRLLAAWLRLSRAVWADLNAAGFDTAVTTCGPRVLPLYRKLGCEVLAERRFGSEVRYFIRFDLASDPLARYGSDADDIPVTVG